MPADQKRAPDLITDDCEPPYGCWELNSGPLDGSSDGSAVKSTVCSSRGPEFDFQLPHGGSQASILGSDALFWHAGIHASIVRARP